MRPMFSYIGSKWNLARRYGPPLYPIVIEPFAGSACYSLYWDCDKVILLDKNPDIIEVWRFLISARPRDILDLPLEFDRIDDLPLPQGARNLIGFWAQKGSGSPAKTRHAWAREYANSDQCKVWGPPVRARIASQVNRIKAWEAYCTDYYNAPQEYSATWFVDPPYEIAGKKCYSYSRVDYADISRFCRSRLGQVLVCENQGAEWLPFLPLHLTSRGMNGKDRSGVTAEVYWTNSMTVESRTSQLPLPFFAAPRGLR